jgi:hypothetical protein
VDYRVPFRFTGKIDKLTISIEPPNLTPEDEKRLREAFEIAQDRPETVAGPRLKAGHLRDAHAPALQVGRCGDATRGASTGLADVGIATMTECS